ncbi:unnamed protein product, partial [Linum tenue]
STAGRPPPPPPQPPPVLTETRSSAVNLAKPPRLLRHQKEEKNCGSCRKRVGLLGFKCRCRKLFCSQHRYPEEHRCSFDYKEFGRKILEQQNPVLESDKLENRV